MVVTDGSNLYAKALKAVCTAIRHQLCGIHRTKEIVAAVIKGIRDYRDSLVKPKKCAKKGRATQTETPAMKRAKTEQAARDEIKKGRFLPVTRRENLNEARMARLKTLLAHHPTRATVREFMDDFYGIFDRKPRHSTTKERWELLVKKPNYTACPMLVLQDEENFDKAVFLSFANLNSTSNEVGRNNRGVRKRQKMHYRFRDNL